MNKIVSVLLSTLLLIAMVSTANAVPINIDSKSGRGSSDWGTTFNPLDTGLDILAGDILSVAVVLNDTWDLHWGNHTVDANGIVVAHPNPSVIGTSSTTSYNGYTGTNGMLTGMINNTFFDIGTNFSEAITISGRLNLLIWDSFYSDNVGSIVAEVNLNPVPEPSTYILFAFGLVGLVAYKKKNWTNRRIS